MRLDNEDLTLITDRIRLAEKYTKEKLEDARRIKTMRRLYQGDHYTDSPLKGVHQDRMILNHVLMFVLIKRAGIAFGEPQFRLNPVREEYSEDLDLRRVVLDDVWREIGAYNAVRAAFVDAKVVGTGVCMTGWQWETADTVLSGQPDEDQAPNLVYDNPTVERLRPEWFGMDPDAPYENWRKGWFAGYKWRRPIFAVRKDPRYEGVAHKLKGNTSSDELEDMFTDSQREEGRDKHLRSVTGYTYYFRDQGIVVDWSEELPDEALYVGDEMGIDYPTDMKGRPYFPFAVLTNIPNLETPFGISDIELAELSQHELNLGRSQLAAARRQSVPQYLYDMGLITEEQLEKLQQGVQNAMVGIGSEALSANKNLRDDVLVPVKRENLHPEVFATLDKSPQEIGEMMRATSYARGAASTDVEFATEAALIAEKTEPVAADERLEFERFVGELGEQTYCNLQQFGDRPREVEVDVQRELEAVGPEGELPGTQAKRKVWKTWDKDALAGEYTVMVEPGSMDQPNSIQNEQKWATRIGLALEAKQQQPELNIVPLLETWLESFDFARVAEVLTPPPPPPMPAQMPGMMPGGMPPGGMPPQGMGGPPGPPMGPDLQQPAPTPEEVAAVEAIMRAQGMG
jgi:hypothetical protein